MNIRPHTTPNSLNWWIGESTSSTWPLNEQVQLLRPFELAKSLAGLWQIFIFASKKANACTIAMHALFDSFILNCLLVYDFAAFF